MTREEVHAKLTQLLVDDFRVPAAKITEDATFRGTFGMDSLDTVDFIYLVSKTFGLKAEISEFRELHSMKLVTAFILNKLEERAPPAT